MTLKKNKNHEEKAYKILCDLVGEAEIIREHRFDTVGKTNKKGKHKLRQWRFDFAIPKHMIAIEVEGGIWTGGRHIHPLGFEKDIEKYNEATRQGWRVYRLTPKFISSSYISSLIPSDYVLYK